MQQQQEKHFQWQQRTFYKLKDALQIIKGTSTTETLWKKKQINKTAWNKQRVDGGKRKKKAGMVQLHRGISRGSIFFNVLECTVQKRSK